MFVNCVLTAYRRYRCYFVQHTTPAPVVNKNAGTVVHEYVLPIPSSTPSHFRTVLTISAGFPYYSAQRAVCLSCLRSP